VEADLRRGRTVVVAVVFAAGLESASPRRVTLCERLAARGVEILFLGLGRGDAEGDQLRLAHILRDLLARTRAREVYVPLGLGGDEVRPLVHEAALQVMSSGGGRNVFLYEERPECLVPGAVRSRLAAVGAWLPPGASHSAAPALFSALLHAHVPAAARGSRIGWNTRLASARAAARASWVSRAWNPQRALGPRLQPVIHVPDDAEAALASAVTAAAAPASPPAAVRRARSLALGYSGALGGRSHAERYWLLLPARGPYASDPDHSSFR
jgi:hypothetical protein